MVLIDAVGVPPQEISKLEPNILLKVDALVYSQVVIPVISKPVTLSPSIEFLYGYPLQINKGPLVFHEILFRILALQQKRLVFLKHRPSQDALCVGNPLIHVHSRGDIKVLKHSAS